MAEPSSTFQILGQPLSEFAATLAQAIVLFFSCVFIALFLFFMLFETTLVKASS